MIKLYWHRRGPFNPERFRNAVQDCRKVCESERFVDLLAGWDGSGDPVYSDSQVSFNSFDKDAHETFSIQREGSKGLESCRTEGAPYDLAARCCLLILRHYMPEEIEISSEDRSMRKWNEAQEIVNEVLEWEDEVALDAVD